MQTDTTPEWPPYPFPVERYCVTSSRAVRGEGDRCIRHGAAATPCTTDVRPAQCQHLHLSPNHPYPLCSECGLDLRGVPGAT